MVSYERGTPAARSSAHDLFVPLACLSEISSETVSSQGNMRLSVGHRKLTVILIELAVHRQGRRDDRLLT